MRKTLLISLAAVTLSLQLCACSENILAISTGATNDVAESTALSVGGFRINEGLTSAGVPDTVQSVFDKAVEFYDEAHLKSVAVIGTQVVAGTNYKILCTVTDVPEGIKPSFVIATIYEDLDGNSEILSVCDYEL